MPRLRKNGERGEQVRKGKKRPAKVEPLRPQAKQPDILRDEMAKFLLECPYPVLRIHRDGTVLYANKASEGLLKAKGSKVGSAAPVQWCRLVEEVLTSGQVAEQETEHNGQIFSFRAVPVVDSNYVNFYGRDITERKRAEETLIKAENEKATILNTMSELVAYQDAEHRIIWANRAAGKSAGSAAEELLGRYCYEVWQGRNKPCVNCPVEKAWKTGRLETEEIHSPDGRAWSIRANPVKNKTGDVVGVAEITLDITERKKAEEALRVSEERFRSLFKQAVDAIVVIDTKTQEMVEFNDKAHEMLGYSQEEYKKLRLSDIEAIESEEKITSHIDKVTSQNGDIFETKQRKKDGTLCDILVSAKHITINNKQYIQGIWRDITQLKKSEERLLKYQKQLKTLASRLALAEEGERRRIARELHDQVAQSLTLAKINLDALHASALSPQPAKTLRETSKAIEKAIQDTRSLTFDLSYPILYELGFEAAVSEWLTENLRDKHGIATEFNDDGRDKPLEDNVKILLFRNVRELLINTIKHANAGKVKVSTRRIDNSIEVTVEDNGIGFDPTEEAPQAGFGLFSVRESLEELGGYFEIESKPGAGCKATMTAPLKNQSLEKED